MKRIINLCKKELVLSISMVLAIISMFLVPVDAGYQSYIDTRTLAILFCLMIIMAGLQKLQVFSQLGEALIKRSSSLRGMALILIGLCFVLSMFITNDVALLTFVPFTVVVLHMSNLDEKLIPVIVLETVAANLGSMMLPMGNPQNLYLYSLTDLSLLSFVKLMLPYGLLSLVCIIVLCFFLVGNGQASLKNPGTYSRSRKEKAQLMVYFLLFVVSLLVVARVVDYKIGFFLVFFIILFMDRRMLVSIDYSLLLTFFFLFIFIGNMKRMDAVANALAGLVSGHEIWTGVIASQVISNVPAAILLSGFTDHIEGLIIGTNLGGLGTLIASMASLISFKLYGLTIGADKKKYLKQFTLVNVALLLLLGILACFLQ